MVPKDCIIGGAERWVGSRDEDRRNPAGCRSCSVASTPTVTLTWKDTRGWSCPLPFNAFRLHTPFLLTELILSRRHKTLLLWSCQGCLGLRAVKDGPYRSAVLLISAHSLHPVSQGTLLSLSTPSLHNPALDHPYLSEQHFPGQHEAISQTVPLPVCTQAWVDILQECGTGHTYDPDVCEGMPVHTTDRHLLT